MEINSPGDVELADALVQLRRAKEEGSELRHAITVVFDLTLPGWRNDEAIVGWLKENGPERAATILLDRYAV